MKMSIEIRQIGAEQLPLYAEVPESFRVENVIRVELIDKGLGGIRFTREKVQPYMKWDKQCDEASGPANWSNRFNISEWGIFMAFLGERPVGGVAVGADAPGGLIAAFERRNNAVLWDIRVHPDERRRGIAAKLFRQAADWAMKKGYSRLKLEVSSVNAAMCNFCARLGCELVAVHRHGYETTLKAAGEAMLIWYYEL